MKYNGPDRRARVIAMGLTFLPNASPIAKDLVAPMALGALTLAARLLAIRIAEIMAGIISYTAFTGPFSIFGL